MLRRVTDKYSNRRNRLSLGSNIDRHRAYHQAEICHITAARHTHGLNDLGASCWYSLKHFSDPPSQLVRLSTRNKLKLSIFHQHTRSFSQEILGTSIGTYHTPTLIQQNRGYL